jgi:molybdenum cofactor biosynthesis enzyme MoaA
MKFVALSKELPIHVRFIELMPFSGNKWDPAQFLGYREALTCIQSHVVMEPIKNETGTCTEFRIQGYQGTVGFISSMTEAFCGTCSRLRLTADGHVKVCLHGDEETDLKPLIRSGNWDGVRTAVAAAVTRKHFSLGGKRDMLQLAASSLLPSARPMIKIGG